MRQNDIGLIAGLVEVTGLGYADILGAFYAETIHPDLNRAVTSALRALGQSEKFAGGPLQHPSIGVVTPGALIGDYVGLLMQGIVETAEAMGYHLAIHAQAPDVPYTALDGYYHALFENGYADDGFLILTAYNSDIPIQMCRDYGCSYILCDCDAGDGSVVNHSRICIDNRTAIKEVVSYLLRLGHRRIGFIAGDLDIPAAAGRLAGYREALAEAGLPANESLITRGDWQVASGTERMRTLLRRPDPPTAVISSNDLMALGALTAIIEAGLRLPDDISLTGFDDIEMASMVSPSLTTVRQPLVEMGTGAVEMLDSLLRDPVLPVQARVFNTLLIIRESTRPPRSGR